MSWEPPNEPGMPPPAMPPPGPPWGGWPPQPAAPYGYIYGPSPTPPARSFPVGWLIGGVTAAFILGMLVGGLAGFLAGDNSVGIDEGFEEGPLVLTYGIAGDLDGFDIAVGACAEGHPEDLDTITSGDAVACEGEHGMEAFATFAAPVIGEDAVIRYSEDDISHFADGGCYLAFESYVGRSFEDSQFDFYAVVPSHDTWASGSNAIHCVLVDVDGQPLRGSARNSGK